MKFKFGIGEKLVFLIEGVVFVAVVLSGIGTFLVSRKVLIDRTKSQLTSIAVLKENSIKKYVGDAKAEIEFFERSGHGRQSLINFLLTGDKDNREMVVNEYFPELIRDENIFKEISLLSTDGVIIASNKISNEGKIKNSEDYFNRGLIETFIQSFYYDQSILETAIVIATPVSDENGKTLGVLAGRLGLDTINELMIERSGLGQSGETFLVNSSNVVITELLKEPGVSLKKTIFLPQISSCLEGKSNFEGNMDYNQDEILGYWHWFPELNSCLVTKIDKNEAFLPLRQTTYVLVAITIVITIFVGYFGYKMGLTITRPIAKLRDFAMKIKEGNFNVNADVHTDDEIGDMAFAFNEMAEKLQVLYMNLEKKIQERTIELNTKLSLIEDQNKSLGENKLAMLNLLEDSKELEETLKVERDQFRAIVSSMGEGLLVVNHERKITIINPAAQKLLGINENDVIGKGWSEITNTFKGGNKVPVEERSFAQVLDGGSEIITELDDDHYYQTKSGKKFPVISITAPLISAGKIVGAVKVFKDATHEKGEKRRIEKIVEERTLELNDEKARLSASINGLPLGFILTDINKNILISNPAAKRILLNSSKSEDVLTFDQIENLIPDIKLKKLLEECKSQKSGKEIKEVTFGSRFLHLFFVPVVTDIKDEVNDYIGTVIIVEDITEAKVLDRSKDEFFSIASHELRTPLTSIRGNTSMIIDHFMGEMKDDSLKEMITDIHESSIRLIGIVNDFLDLSRLEQNRLQYKNEKINIVLLTKEVLTELSPDSKEISLKVSTEKKSINVFADKNKVKEVLINIIGNSLKFTEKGFVTVSFDLHDKMVETIITDTGRGIPVASQNLLFRKFQQAGDSLLTRDTTKGTGLGLYISKLMVEGMGGKIKLISSEVGGGTVFSFTLPVA